MADKRETKRTWRTREDPFKEVWNEVESKLETEPSLNAKTLFRGLQQRYPGRFSDGQLRTLQRRIKSWHDFWQSKEGAFLWMLGVLQGGSGYSVLEDQLEGKLGSQDLGKLYEYVLDKPLRYRNRAISILSYLYGIRESVIADFLFIETKTIRAYIHRWRMGGFEELFDFSRKDIKKCKDETFIDAIFTILHAPPSSYGINRTTWKMEDIHRIMAQEGLPISVINIRKIIKDAGYSVRKAKKVLTSTDPNYREKLEEITRILSHLGEKEKFFSVDEFGPFSVKIHGGRSLVPKGEVKEIPQYQKSKGSLILTGALELSTNQMTHFYSDKKDTDEMITLLDILLVKYADEQCIYLSWDAASWHISKKLNERVDEINNPEYRKEHTVPMVKLAPLPASAQFLNVIESVFSGMARAILHNSDYESVEECMKAIDRYFAERNQSFLENPKRAGNKIWGDERVEAKFSESNNCKDPRWR
jgi:transposase